LVFELLCFKIVKNIEELKQSVEEKASAVKKAEEGASDLKNTVDELTKSLEEHEKEYQVTGLKLSVMSISGISFGVYLILLLKF